MTIQELILSLSTILADNDGGDMPVVIQDADTSWWLNLESAHKSGDCVALTSSYHNRYDDEYHD